ncbi:alpha/beta hydrolase [Luteimonas sp. BDR2-5]|uniref:alpha/beta hydrolase n=1 Tax=Proluteimonas luteida TaxID=2878685 RepID=UPI001E35D541|nr:alpha/beta hydrolase [Luteimonas sp. BDR2-5]MCD9028786.1 alpha/beta hydrolase [Luteimonas sp. BDR2-5]
MRRQTRWTGLLAALLLACSGAAAAQPALRTIPLWPAGHLPQTVNGPEQVGNEGGAMGAVTRVSEPRMEIHRPAQPNGTAVLILGGGGYFRIQVGTAARPMAQWLASIGVTSAVLYYRMPVDGWPASAPFADGQRAMRLLRAHAGELGIDPQKIGVMGSSAGANLGGILATRFDHDFYPALDASDRLPSRPDFLVMLYPVVTLKPPYDTTRSRRELATQADAVEAYSVEAHVRADMPPVFLAHAADDRIADVGHSLLMFQAARAHDVPAELHVFERGGHSWGLGRPGTQVAQWPRLFATWARAHGFMAAPAAGLQPLTGAGLAPTRAAPVDDDAPFEDEGD